MQTAVELQTENARLRRTLSELMDRSEGNQQILRRFYDYESGLLACNQLPALMQLLTEGAQQHFDLQAVAVLLDDPDHQFRTLIQPLIDPALPVRFLHDSTATRNYLGVLGTSIYLGPLPNRDRVRYFPDLDVTIQSCALLPLQQDGKVIGCIAYGSDNTERFTDDKSTDFLAHLARIIATCIDNALIHETLRRQTQTDVLTHLHNRRFFDEALDREIAIGLRSGLPVACVFLDIDHFKQINDTRGHQTGDLCLQQAAETIRKQLRKADVLARYGGEEFVCLLPGADPEKAIQTAERIRQAVEALPCRSHTDDMFNITLSAGVSVWDVEKNRDTGNVAAQLVSSADAAMYEAKHSGRNRVCYRDFGAED
ncbi:MAG TPA: sensor domain-containing diguanylate cyclase [Pseudomonadales bacterium]|nr:sensor domain-containing diguanylate cyclase [Pseudomonadales bacterium]